MYEMTMWQCVWESGSDEPTVIYEPAAPLSFTELNNELQLIVYLPGHNFAVLVHSQCSHGIIFREKAVNTHCSLPA